jgi:hypothetical protein
MFGHIQKYNICNNIAINYSKNIYYFLVTKYE